MEISKIKIGSTVYDVKDANALNTSDVTNAINTALYGSSTKPSGAQVVTTQNIATIAQNYGIGGTGGDGDTLNTAGATNNAGAKMFLIGATTQSTSTQTYSNSNCYIGTDNCLYTNGNKAVNSSDVTNAINTELYGSATKPANASVVTTQNISTAIQNAGITTGGASTYAQLQYSVSRVNGSGALTLAGTDPVYVVSVADNISSVALQNNPIYGHSCHIIFKSADSSSHTIAIGNDNTNRICPTDAGLTFTVPAAGTGYIEVDFLNVGNSSIGDEVYVRGI